MGLTALAWMAACSSPEEKIDETAHTVRSWSATADVTSRLFAAGSVPRVYASQILRGAQQMMEELSTQQEWQTLSASSRHELERAIQELDSSLNKR